MSRVPKAKTSGMQDKGKPIMQPEAPWKAMPNLGAMPMAGPGQGRTFTAAQAIKGANPVKDPQVSNQNEFAGFGGFIDTGLTSVSQKMFPQEMPKTPGTQYGTSVGGFPANADIGSGYGGITNAGGGKEFPASGGEKPATSVKGGKKPGGR